MTTKAIRQKALTLSSSEKLSLMQDLWDSLAEDQESVPLSAEHACIIDERLATAETHPNEVVSWTDALKYARRQVAKKKKSR